MKKLITIITPCFNEEKCIEKCYLEIKNLFKNKLSNYDYEHIFADNNSSDNTIAILKKICTIDDKVKLIINSRNFGVFKSTFNAISYSKGNAVIPMYDADLQDPAELIIDFIKYWEKGFKVVAGSRSDRFENFFMKNIRRIYYRIIKIFSTIDIYNDVGEYQLVDREIINSLLKFNDHNPYIRGMIASIGFDTKIIKYKHQKRIAGKSKFNIFQYFDIFLNGLISFSHLPMRVSIYIGFLISLTSIGYSIYLFCSSLFYGNIPDSPGIMTLLVGSFFLLGIILFFLGILGEYMSAIHSQVRKGPMVIEKEKINF